MATPRRFTGNLMDLDISHLRPREQPTLRTSDLRLTATELAAQAAVLPGFLKAIVQAFTAGILRGPTAQTPEGRSRALGDLRQLLEDAMLDGVREVRPPEAATAPARTPRTR